NDARLAWFGSCYDDVHSATVAGCPAHHPAISTQLLDPDDPSKGHVGLELQKWNAEARNFADDVPYFRVAEMLLIQAEARLRGGFGDPSVPLNTLRNARGLTNFSGTITMDTILEARRREFIGEGQRFWDLKRLGRDIPKVPSQQAFNPNVPDFVPFSRFNIIDKLPSSQIELSEQNAPEDSVLIQNPGY